jgi:aspartate aminotransferase-like enzyme
MQKQYLLTPGPTPVPERVLLAMAQPVLHHRMPAFAEIMKEVLEGLRWLYGTKDPVVILNGSGTAAMEASVVSFQRRGDKALVIRGGKFGERWGEINVAYGVECVYLDVPWGTAVDPAAVEAALAKDPAIKTVFATANESSTGVWHPVDRLAKITRAKDDVLLVVDAVSALGAVPMPMDEWGIDVLVTGSQKALMLPPGLAFVGAGGRAWARAEKANLPRFYLDLRAEKKAQEGGETAFTPGVSLIVGLREALRMIREETLPKLYDRHSRLARATRAAALALGCELYAPTAPSPTVTSIKSPGIDSGQIVKHLRGKYGVSIVGGQGALKGKIFRVAHLGYYSPFDILTVVAALEMGLNDLGVKVERGAGTRAAEEILAS